MLNVNLEKFWEEDEKAHKENCFSKQSNQVALGIRMSDECVFSELKEEGTPWLTTQREKRIALNKRYNDLAEEIVGKRLLKEKFDPVDAMFPAYKDIGEIFGGEYMVGEQSIWLHSDITTPNQLEKQLDKIDRMDFESFVLPANWEKEKKRIYEQYGKRPDVHRWVRGPVTLATSIMGVENFIFLLVDEPELAIRFSETIKNVIFKYITLFDKEAGYKEGESPSGFGFADDDCALLTPDMYELFAYPILRDIFTKVSPKLEDMRYQHSDSDMGHLLPILSRLNLTGCNFGPTLTVRQIRECMPTTRINGQLAPFTFMRNDQEQIIKEVKRDCEMAKEGDLRGLNLTTAGSINDGSSLMSMRAVMYAIQEYGQYNS